MQARRAYQQKIFDDNILKVMHPVDEAPAILKSPDAANITSTARGFSVDRATLGRRFSSKTTWRACAAEQCSLLSHRQEKMLLKDFNELCQQGFLPTLSIVCNFHMSWLN